jgi:hypothetical protein
MPPSRSKEDIESIINRQLVYLLLGKAQVAAFMAATPMLLA